MKAWLSGLFAPRPRTIRNRPSHRLRPRLEPLESRDLPALHVLGSFAGLDFGDSGGFEPPDTSLAVGPTRVVEQVNSAVALYDKSGTRLDRMRGGPFFGKSTDDFVFDPVCVYDEYAERFVVAQLQLDLDNSRSYLLLAISDTSEPDDLTAGWSEMHAVELTQTDGSGESYWADYPKLGYNREAYVFSFNMFGFTTSQAHASVLTLDKSTLLDADPGTITSYQVDPPGGLFTMAPAVMHGAPADSPIWFATTEWAGGDEITVTRMDNVLSPDPTFTHTSVTVASYTIPGPVTQPDGSTLTTDLIDARTMNAAWFADRLVTAHTIGNGEKINAAWYEFSTAGTPKLTQSGVIDPGDNISTFYPAIEINPSGQLGMTYMQVGNDVGGEFISMYMTGQQKDAPRNEMEPGLLIQAGAAIYTGDRQGDYAGIQVDPLDGTFWGANEFIHSDASWATAVGHVSLNPAAVVIVATATGTYGGTVELRATLLDDKGNPLADKSLDFTFGGTAVGTVTTAGNGVAVLPDVSLAGINAGTYVAYVGAHFAGDADFDAGDGSGDLVVNKARAALEVTGYDVTYDGGPHTATGTATGVLGEDLSALLDFSGTTHTDAGVYDDTVLFTGDDNYEADSAAVVDTIRKADQAIAFDPLPDRAYGDVFLVDATASSGLAVSFRIVSGAATADFDAGLGAWVITVTGLGTITVQAEQPGDDNYNAADPVRQSFDAHKARATFDVPGYSVTYDGRSHTATGTATGAFGEDLSDLLDYSATTHTGAGTYEDTVPFAGNDFYEAEDIAVTNVIAKARADIRVTAYSVTYDGGAHAATGTATGVLGEDLSDLLDFSGTTHTDAGVYDDTVTFAGNTNYEADSAALTNTIAKARAELRVIGYDVTYDGGAHAATGTATGVLGEDLSALLDFSATTHTDVGTYSDTVTFAGNDNYEADSAPVTDVIRKARAAINVPGYSVTYDGGPHTATGTATGVRGEELSDLLDFSGTTHTDAGTYEDTVVFAGNDTYEAESVTVTDVIARAGADIRLTGYDVTYDGGAHTATGTATGVLGEDLSDLLDFSGTTHTDAGRYADAVTFAGNSNYRPDSVAVTDRIRKAGNSIDFLPPPDRAFGDGPFGLSASATSGLPVGFRVVSGPAVIVSGNMVQLLGWGAVTIEASQPGDTNHRAAAPVTRTFAAAAPAVGADSIIAAGRLDVLPAAAGALAADAAGPIHFNAAVTLDRTLRNARGSIFIWLERAEGAGTATYFARADAITSVKRASNKKTATALAAATIFKVAGGETTQLAADVPLRLDFADGRLFTAGADDQVGITLGTAGDLWLSNNWGRSRKATTPQPVWSPIELHVSADRESATFTAAGRAYFTYKAAKARTAVYLDSSSAEGLKAYLNTITGKAVESVERDGDTWTIVLKPRKKLDWSRLQGYAGNAFGVAIG